MKQTEEDRRFAKRFAEALLPHVTDERNEGKPLAQIAARLGVTAAGLQKQLAGGTPSIRTIALAHSIYGVAVPYEGIDISKAVSVKRGKRQRVEERQLVLPFEIWSMFLALLSIFTFSSIICLRFLCCDFVASSLPRTLPPPRVA